MGAKEARRTPPQVSGDLEESWLGTEEVLNVAREQEGRDLRNVVLTYRRASAKEAMLLAAVAL
jgi:hypothetical protein